MIASDGFGRKVKICQDSEAQVASDVKERQVLGASQLEQLLEAKQLATHNCRSTDSVRWASHKDIFDTVIRDILVTTPFIYDRHSFLVSARAEAERFLSIEHNLPAGMGPCMVCATHIATNHESGRHAQRSVSGHRFAI